MTQRTDDLRIKNVRPLLPAAILDEESPAGKKTKKTVQNSRQAVSDSLAGKDLRVVVVVGPCSIHDVQAGGEYAEKLKRVADRLSEDLIILMRSYFEKPRTTVGWKGLVNDPRLDGSFAVNEGLRIARQFLCRLGEMEMPAGTEFLDTTFPQHLADLVTWGAIGARTVESQLHREMASGLSTPVGFKNATDGGIKVAVDAVMAARHSHWFAGSTKDGLSALIQTTGNDQGHVILRGGSRTGPNYAESFVEEARKLLAASALPERVMVDFSHANSGKSHLKQLEVGQSVAGQIQDDRTSIFGVMIESFLVEGRQDVVPGKKLVYGQSITDSCLSFEQTVPLLETLANAANGRRRRRRS